MGSKELELPKHPEAPSRRHVDRVALGAGVTFIAIVAICLCAPLYARYVARTGPFANHLTQQVTVSGQATDVVGADGVPIGPGLHSRFLLGADANGRDEMVRLLYGGRVSLLIALVACLITLTLAISIGVLAGYRRGWVDALFSRAMDLLWAFPVLLLGLALGTALAVGGLKVGPIEVPADSLLIPILIIGVVSVPYVAKPIRAQVLTLREQGFIEAAESQGLTAWQVVAKELLPNLTSTILVFSTLTFANNILFESALSFLGAGVHTPHASWGNMVRMSRSSWNFTAIPT